MSFRLTPILRNLPRFVYTAYAGFDGRRGEWEVHSLFLLPKIGLEPRTLMSQAELNEKILREFSAIAGDAGCELLECQFRGGVLRLVLDRPGGVTLKNCQGVSKQISALLDVEEFGNGKYTLEVSSPGLDRKFYCDEDFDRFRGRMIRLTWKKQDMSHKKTVVGTLAEYSIDEREVMLNPTEGTDVYRISLDDIVVARLEPEL